MTITPIITATESDVFLSTNSDWLALTDTVKDTHIYSGSLYIQMNWTCLDDDDDAVDWEDTDTVPAEVKHACALYALADSVDNLYGDVETADTRKTKKELVKVGSVTVDTTFTSGVAAMTGSLSKFGFADELMRVNCTSDRCTLTRN